MIAVGGNGLLVSITDHELGYCDVWYLQVEPVLVQSTDMMLNWLLWQVLVWVGLELRFGKGKLK